MTNADIKNAKDPDEIKSVLLGAMVQERVFTVWQRRPDEELAFQITAKLLNIDEFGRLKFTSQNNIPEINKSEVFFAIEDSTVVFKAKQVDVSGNHITVGAPNEAKYRERRRHKRTRFKFKDHKDAELIFENLIDEETGEAVVTRSKVLDISDSGACFLVSKETLGKIDPEIAFKIKSLSDIKFNSSNAKIMNARKYKGRKLNQEELFAIGVVFY